ncbi:unnamed protein product [Periconia digitata]|uniref:Ubiquinone biosynthesis protein n=1 Tax=Periconia digitata TaxID=1303443 RepID=A0A9W4UGV1_9PLEO|nr:unnamed protein product [Periconia digitata]
MPPTQLARALPRTSRTASSRGAEGFRQRCCYHSSQYSQPPPFAPAESAILSAAMSHVPNVGFTIDALKLGARDANYLDASTNLFPRGVFDLVNYHLVTQRLALKDTVQFPPEGENGKKLGIGSKIRTLALARLRANEPVIDKWQEALAIMAQPSFIPPSLAELARLADEIWYLAGDKSVDGSWYTKRASFSAIYSSTEVFMTQDKSKDFRETEQFLDARLADSMKLGSTFGALSAWTDYTAHSAVNVLRSKGVRI